VLKLLGVLGVLELELYKKIWITWENQRRSIELAKYFGCDLYIFEYKGLTKYLKSIVKTITTIQRTKPDIIFVQNPSMILATLACLIKIITGIPLVVDRHTTFLLSRKYRNTPPIIIFKLLHRFTIRYASLTIVTNQYLADIVTSLGGQAFVLPDKLPDISCNKTRQLKGKVNILLVSSFGIDEPIKESIEGMRLLGEDSVLYITGNYKKLDPVIVNSVPGNVIFTGFVPVEEYEDLLCSADIIMALTTAEYCMLCGCYEALAVEKPLITSDKKVLREYFSDAQFTDNTSAGIANAIKVTSANLTNEKEKITRLSKNLKKNWEQRYLKLEKEVESILQ
jgi:glycosyltransferase involved in cell wall biosynthesis